MTQSGPDDTGADSTATPFRDVNADTANRRIADDLRQARLGRAMELREVSDILRIRSVYLEALEDGRFGDLPGPTYVAGFLRTYGDYLGLDGEELVRRYKDVSGGVLAHAELSFPVPASEARQPTTAIILGTLVLAIAGAAIWYVLNERSRVDLELVPEVPDEISSPAADDSNATSSDAAGEAVGSNETATVTPEVTAEPAAEIATQVEAQVEADPVTELEEAAELVEPVVEEAEDAAAPAVDEETAAFAGTDALLETGNGYVPRIYGRTNTDYRVEIRALEETWIQVEGDNGSILLTRVLLPGDIYRVPDRDDVTLDTGNAGGLKVMVDGAQIAPLGEPGVVVRNIPLGADALLAR
ncbi:MAG: helix-turn-helix domain-containing protein [Rhodospirillales bacterium]|nr:helix-turn-helix domain-containing protein [Rhodospirillales bacterium]